MKKTFFCFILATFSASIITGKANAQTIPANYDEAKVGPYTLPDPLLRKGKRITSAAQWMKEQRPAMLRLFKQHVYGEYPGRPPGMHFRINDVDSSALNGKAIRKRVTIFFTAGEDGPGMDLLLYLPKNSRGPVPVFTGLNFCGNHCITTEADIPLSTQWMQNTENKEVMNNRATDKARGLQARRWPIEEIINRGYGLATAYYGDVEPDHPEGWKSGIRSTLQTPLNSKPEDWSAIGAWAWSLSRIMDYLETDRAVNAKEVILTGHSRIGKAALWAGANDTRFQIIISNNSGEGGAALARRWYGETIAHLNQGFPHWFVSKYKEYNTRPERLPVDQHILVSLLAPRPVYIASAKDDEWADPKGEFLSGKHSEPVYALFGKKGLGVKEMPPPNQPVGETIRYHIRTGKHDVTFYDWQQYLHFADRHLKKKR